MGKTRALVKKIRYQGDISCKDGHNKGQKWYGPNRSKKILRRGGKKTQRNIVISLSYSYQQSHNLEIQQKNMYFNVFKYEYSLR